MSTVDQTPKRPALAYHVMDELLPPGFLCGRPPKGGWKFAVTGEDGVTTHWVIPHKYAAILDHNLRHHPNIVSVVHSK